MAELVAVGVRTFVTALAGIGAEPIRCETVEEFGDALKRLGIRKDVRLAFISEAHAEAAPEAIEAFRKRSSAALPSLPPAPSEDHPSLHQVRYLIEQATGARLI